MGKSTKSNKSKRIDEILVERGLVSSVKQAQAFIYSGRVSTSSSLLDKPGTLISPDQLISLRAPTPFVGRGGEKLAFAIEHFSLKDNLSNKVVLDVGASTGGFTDCLLQHGVKKVIALDVGYNQLDWKLRNDSRVISLERTNIKSYSAAEHNRVDFLVADISFSSLSNVIRELIYCFKDTKKVEMLLLVKPQFELGKHEVPPGGVVSDDILRQKAVDKVKAVFQKWGQFSFRQVDSFLPGRKGNREIFIHVKAG